MKRDQNTDLAPGGASPAQQPYGQNARPLHENGTSTRSSQASTALGPALALVMILAWMPEARGQELEETAR